MNAKELLDQHPLRERLSPKEFTAIESAINAADEFGYGNLIAWLGMAWAVKLRGGGLSERVAIDAVSHRAPYPLPKKSKGGK